jgi:hypothetical protein
MKNFLYFIIIIALIAFFSNPNLNKFRKHLNSETGVGLVNKGLNYLSGEHLGVSICRENDYFFSVFTVTSNVKAFDMTFSTKGCQIYAYGAFGMIFPISEKTKNEIDDYVEQESDGKGFDCNGDCEEL